MRLLAHLAMLLLRSLPALFRNRTDQALVELALRQQLATYSRKGSKPRITSLDRIFWVVLSRAWPRWKDVLCIVKPDTVVRWHRKGFRLYWRTFSKPGPGRPPISEELQELIGRLATENPWRARKIQAELAKLGFTVSPATVSRYLPKRRPDEGQRQRWRTFLRNHRDGIAGMDFFVIPTVRFRLLYAWFVLEHGRRRVLHINVTAHPTSQWVIQQLREAFPCEPRLRYLIHDNDSIFSEDVTRAIESLPLVPTRTAYRSPWHNGTVERWVGSVRRELLDHVIVFDEDHLRRMLHDYVAYYNAERVYTALCDSPEGRRIERRPSRRAQVIALTRLGGLHHRYAWREAA